MGNRVIAAMPRCQVDLQGTRTFESSQKRDRDAACTMVCVKTGNSHAGRSARCKLLVPGGDDLVLTVFCVSSTVALGIFALTLFHAATTSSSAREWG